MEPKSFVPPESESKIEKRIIASLTLRGWYCKKTHSNEFQIGFPDLFVCHTMYGSRWIEVKRPKGYAFTKDQLIEFPKFHSGIWVLVDDNEYELKKLFGPYNWYWYLDVMKAVSRARGTLKEISERQKRIASSGPEREIQNDVIQELTSEGWFVKETHGNIFQSGLPDLYASHKKYGARWIEIKQPTGYKFTPAQMETFPKFNAHGVGVWILNASGQTGRLFEPYNWRSYVN